MGGDATASMDPVEDDAARFGSQLSSSLRRWPPMALSSPPVCVSTPFPTPFGNLRPGRRGMRHRRVDLHQEGAGPMAEIQAVAAGN
jgi:hypothetical protein